MGNYRRLYVNVPSTSVPVATFRSRKAFVLSIQVPKFLPLFPFVEEIGFESQKC